MLVSVLIMLAGVTIAALSQLILKKAADKHYDSLIQQYMNVPVMLGYGMMFGSTFCTILAHRKLPLSWSPLWDAASQILVILIGLLVLHEKISKRKAAGFCLMIAGILIFLL
ncbi:MAG: multidrug transporter [Solobacterium sp.]|nr:multidrug transporter [Solobacterium sp.]